MSHTVTEQPAPSAPPSYEEAVSVNQIDPVINNQPTTDPPLDEEEQKKKRRQAEECCCDCDTDENEVDCCLYICYLFCRPCGHFCKAIGECTDDCCTGCANGLHDCCETSPDATDTQDNGFCCDGGCCDDGDCCDGDCCDSD